MKYQITITADDETVYTHEWENINENIVFGFTPQTAALSPENFDILANVLEMVGMSFDILRFFNPEDIPTGTVNEKLPQPDYLEDRMMQEALLQIFAQIEAEALFDGVEASA